MQHASGQTTDERFQKVDNYRDEAGLAVRQGLYAYKTPDYDLPGVVISRLAGRPKRVLDVGCGNGRYTTRLRESFPGAEVIGVDLAPGILESVPEPTVAADVADLPFEDGSADVVLAMHMLYHVPDIAAALDELQRVLAPGGVLFISTLASDDKVEYEPLWQEAARAVLGTELRLPRSVLIERFSLEIAESMVTERFGSVELHDLPGVIELPEPGPLMAAFRSEEDFFALSPGDFGRLMDEIERRLEARFAGGGVLRITSRSGILECRDAKR
ncbi:class I SAM-dependent methyltransferase [Glycomyces sp. NPDC021274]|uniref:class I SAM-dependent methyltransferase n=1 Tax=Glycomyces sp. NPDC021274 TaxID=3155120 RepID=UPI0033F0BA83